VGSKPVAEIHHPEHWTVAARATLRLFDLCDSDEVELTLSAREARAEAGRCLRCDFGKTIVSREEE